MPIIFLSYRREDSIDIAGRIYDRLAAHFGSESVFMDVDSIPLGVDFRSFLSHWVSKCDALVAVVGDGWLDVRNPDGSQRLDDPVDFVGIEISTALERGIPVIPLLVGRASMPKRNELPEVLADFAYRNAAEVRSGRDFHNHMNRLVGDIEQSVNAQPVTRKKVSEPRNSGPAKAVNVVDPATVAKPTNLGFEGDVVDGIPKGWSNSLGFVSGASIQYDFTVLPRNDGVTGKCVRLQRSKADEKEFGSFMQRCPANHLVGKRVRVEAELRTENLDSWAGLWLRIDGESNHVFFDNMRDRPIKGTTPWTTYAQETDIPMGSEWLNFGCLLAASGTLWADNFLVSIYDNEAQWIAI